VSNDNVVKLIQPGTFTDHFTEALRNGACALLTRTVEADVAEFLSRNADLKIGDGHRRVVRHGHLPEREIMTGVGPFAARQPRVRDRETGAGGPEGREGRFMTRSPPLLSAIFGALRLRRKSSSAYLLRRFP
jgi:hypothetical protein